MAPGPVGSGFAARACMQMGMAETPNTVARVSWCALAGGGTVRPGFQAKLLGWGLAVLPRRAPVRMLGQMMPGLGTKAMGQVFSPCLKWALPE